MFLSELKDKECARLDETELLNRTQSSLEGLNDKQVIERINSDGLNVIQSHKQKPWFLVLGANFISMMAILLWLGSIMSLLRECQNLE